MSCQLIATRLCVIFSGILSFTCCVPTQIQQKYQPTSYLDNEPPAMNAEKPVSEGGTTVATPLPIKNDKAGTTVYMVDKNTFRFLLKPAQVWDGAVNILMRNYNLNIIDKPSGIITTEWDSYYQDNRLYRNKVTVLMKNVSWNNADVVVFNNTEVLRDSQSGGMEAVWLPAKGDDREMGRIVQNMALYLNQPIPTLPESMVATAPREKSLHAE